MDQTTHYRQLQPADRMTMASMKEPGCSVAMARGQRMLAGGLQSSGSGRSRQVAGCALFGQYQPATKGEIVSAAKATLDKWL
jgi:hypothetical protein